MSAPPRVEGAEASVADYIRDAWSQALVAATDAREDTQRIVARVAGWAGTRPDEARRLAVELTERLQRDRTALESSVESAVRRAVAPFRLPPPAQFAAVEARLRELESRLDRLVVARKARGRRGEG